jgi:flagellar hook-length control protein FliK
MMQTQALPLQISGASASPAPTRANGAANTDSSQFSHALSREIDQRQNSAASEPAPGKAPAAPAQQAPAQAAAPAQAKAADGKTAGAATGDGADDATDDAADAAAATPVADMLALVASFNQPVAAAPDAGPAAAAAAARAAGLPGTFDKRARDDAGIAAFAKVAAGGKGLPASDGAAATDAAAAFALKMPPADVAPKGAAGAPKAAAGVGEATRGSGALDAVTGAAAQTDDAHGAAATFKGAADKAALQGAPVQPDQLRTREADLAALKDLPAAAPLTAPAQQASTAISQAAVGAPADRIAARVGTPGWDNQVGQKIVWMVAGKEQSASLTLNPPDMGPMQVVLNVTNDQATVTFTAAQPEVRQALENAMPKLREMMGESGIALGNATVNAGSPDQRQAQQGEQSRGGGSGGRFGGGGGGGETAIAAVTARPLRAGEGLVDTFA